MSASGYTNQFFLRLPRALLALVLGLSMGSIAMADIILIGSTDIRRDAVSFQPLQPLKTDHSKAKAVAKNTYSGFAQESAENGVPALSALSSLGRDEKSVEYVQAKNFRYYVMPNILENPSEMERITLSHQASGTQSRMLVMNK